MEHRREEPGIQQNEEPELQYTRNAAGVLLEYRKLPDGTISYREINEAHEGVAVSNDSGFEFRAYGKVHEIPHIMRQIGASMGSDIVEATQIRSPEQYASGVNNYPHSAYMGDDESLDEDEQAAIKAAQMHKQKGIQWHDVPAPAPLPEWSGKPRSHKGVVLGTIALVVLGLGLDGVHAVNEAPANTTACAHEGGFFSGFTTPFCVGQRFFEDMFHPFDSSNPVVTKSERK